MRIIQSTVALLLASLLVSPGAYAEDKYEETIKVFKQAGESSDFFETAYGYAVFPTVGKAGMGIGGSHGSGRVYVGGKYVGDAKLNKLSVGMQLGGQAFSQIIFFEDERAFNDFASGDFALGAQMSAVAITAGIAAEGSTAGGANTSASAGKNDASTTGKYSKGMAVFTVAKGGLMYEVSVGGQKFSYKPLEAKKAS
jgi:lipid-binding SYLF domain-containing protein